MLSDLVWALASLGNAVWLAEVLHWLLQRHEPCQHGRETLVTSSPSMYWTCCDCWHVTPLGYVTGASNRRARQP